MLIGIDLDNTIVCYDSAFSSAARAFGLKYDGKILSKTTAKMLFLSQPDGERQWQRFQGQIYSRYIAQAQLFDGFDTFVAWAKRTGAALKIISHKTQYGHFDPERIDLREAALTWMTRQGFFRQQGMGFLHDDVEFHACAEDKVAAIGRHNCSHFIDDLPDMLLHPAFPRETRGILFAPQGYEGDLPFCRSWMEVARKVLP